MQIGAEDGAKLIQQSHERMPIGIDWTTVGRRAGRSTLSCCQEGINKSERTSFYLLYQRGDKKVNSIWVYLQHLSLLFIYYKKEKKDRLAGHSDWIIKRIFQLFWSYAKIWGLIFPMIENLTLFNFCNHYFPTPGIKTSY